MSLIPKSRVEPDAGSYQNYDIDTDYTHDLGLAVLPIATDVPAVRIIRLHGGYAKRRVKWKAGRLGAPPMIPAATDAPGGDVLLSSRVTPALPHANMDTGLYDWKVEGEYLYVQPSPRVAGVNAFPVGVYPFPVLPQINTAADLLGNITFSSLDSMTEYAVANVDLTPNGTPIWPLLALPAAASSTHIVG